MTSDSSLDTLLSDLVSNVCFLSSPVSKIFKLNLKETFTSDLELFLKQTALWGIFVLVEGYRQLQMVEAYYDWN